MINKFHFKSFGNLDDDPNADFFINSMDVMHSCQMVQSIKNRAIAAMNLNIGDKVLEAGCGHGEDAKKISDIVGEQGLVAAIDASHKVINEAQRRYTKDNIHYSVMSVKDLKFEDNFFSACHTDRLLVGHENYEESFNQLLRVVKPKGTICITDVDALSIIIYPFNDHINKILKQIHRSFVNPYIGRILPELFVKRNLQRIKVIPELLVIDNFDILSQIFHFPSIINILINKQELTIPEANNCMNMMHQASQNGSFIYSVTFFTVVGQKP